MTRRYGVRDDRGTGGNGVVGADGGFPYDRSFGPAARTRDAYGGVWMGHGLHDLAGHNAWATAQVLAFCRGLDGPTLDATVPGTYGTIIETLRHLIDAEASYLFRLTG